MTAIYYKGNLLHVSDDSTWCNRYVQRLINNGNNNTDFRIFTDSEIKKFPKELESYISMRGLK